MTIRASVIWTCDPEPPDPTIVFAMTLTHFSHAKIGTRSTRVALQPPLLDIITSASTPDFAYVP